MERAAPLLFYLYCLKNDMNAMTWAGAILAKHANPATTKNACLQPVSGLDQGRMSTQRLLFFDVETTGVLRKNDRDVTKSATWPRVVSLAWVLADASGVLRHGHRVVKPDGWTIPQSATDCHGITTKHARETGTPVAAVLRELVDACRELRPDVAVAHNLEFDYKMVGSELHKSGLPQILTGLRLCCTMKNSIYLCNLPGRYGEPKWPRLTELHEKLFGCGFPDAHDAMADVAALIRCYCAMCQLGCLSGYPVLNFPHNLKTIHE